MAEREEVSPVSDSEPGDRNGGGAAQRADRRHLVPTILIIVASILLFFAAFATWVKRQALETDTWVETSSELLEDDDIQDALANFLVTELYANVDVEAELAQILPPELQRLAGPAAGALRELALRTAREALSRPAIQTLWEEANRAAHERLIALVEDDIPATEDGTVTLDLGTIVGSIGDEIGVGANLADRLPPDAAQLEVLKADQLETAQSGVRILRALVWILVVLTIVLYALAIYLARGRRRETVRATGISLLVVGALVLLGDRLAGNAVVDSLAATAAAEPAADSVWTIGTSQLVAIGQAGVIYGVVLILGAWLAGPSGWATSARRAIAPYMAQPYMAYAALAVLLILIFWWGPTEATRRLIPSLLLIVLAVIGFEALRRQVVRDFPDARPS
jgi:hypothetical protein